VRVRIDPNPEETQRACHAIVASSLPRTRGSVTFLLLYAGVIGAAFVFARKTFAETAAIGIGAAFASMLAFQATARRMTRRLFAADPHSREPHHVELSEDGLRVWCDHVDSKYIWNGTVRVIENAEFYLFVRHSGNGVAIPKRVLDAEREQELRASIRAWSPDRGTSLDPDGAGLPAHADRNVSPKPPVS
jgi:hypothetical protein